MIKISSMVASRAAGGIVGGALGMDADYVLFNIDETQNRKTYKQEIIATVKKGQAEKLALMG